MANPRPLRKLSQGFYKSLKVLLPWAALTGSLFPKSSILSFFALQLISPVQYINCDTILYTFPLKHILKLDNKKHLVFKLWYIPNQGTFHWQVFLLKFLTFQHSTPPPPSLVCFLVTLLKSRSFPLNRGCNSNFFSSSPHLISALLRELYYQATEFTSLKLAIHFLQRMPINSLKVTLLIWWEI